MSQIFKEDGEVIPVTMVKTGPCFVTQMKSSAAGNPTEGLSLQIGFEEIAEKKICKPQLGHLKDLPKLKFLREFPDVECFHLKRGDQFNVEIFQVGEKVTVTGISKGKGFQGVVKRHGFAGGPATHGHKDNLRMPGAIGAGGVQRVFKGLRMAGRQGGEQITVKNLEIVEINALNNIMKIKGALPGGRNSLLIIKSPGKIQIKEKEGQQETTGINNESK